MTSPISPSQTLKVSITIEYQDIGHHDRTVVFTAESIEDVSNRFITLVDTVLKPEYESYRSWKPKAGYRLG